MDLIILEIDIFHVFFLMTSYMTVLLYNFSIEEDFVTWREKFWPAVCEHFGVEATGDQVK